MPATIEVTAATETGVPSGVSQNVKCLSTKREPAQEAVSTAKSSPAVSTNSPHK
jgi:hypothetical protein